MLPPDALYCPKCGTPTHPPQAGVSLIRVSADGSSGPPVAINGEILIGKQPECTIDVSDDVHASRKHARVCHVDGQVVVEDLGSSNGTTVRTRGRLVMAPGDELIIGDSRFRLEHRVPGGSAR
jgi:pSer/pThr/pTyr-binding forkhead associated (FHA) protein